MSATSILNSVIFGSAAMIGGAMTMYKFLKHSRFDGYIFDTFKEDDEMFNILFNILKYVSNSNKCQVRKDTKWKYDGLKHVISRDLVCLKDINSWTGSPWKFRIVFYKKKHKGIDLDLDVESLLSEKDIDVSNLKLHRKRKSKYRIMMICRTREYADHFQNWIKSKEFKPEMLHISSCEIYERDIKI